MRPQPKLSCLESFLTKHGAELLNRKVQIHNSGHYRVYWQWNLCSINIGKMKINIKKWVSSRQAVKNWLLICHLRSHIKYVEEAFFFKDFFFWCGSFLVFIEFVTILLLFCVLVLWPWGIWNLSSLTRDWTWTPDTGRWNLHLWTTRDVPRGLLIA